MSSFANAMNQIKETTALAPAAPTPKPKIKKIKVANTGTELKKLADIAHDAIKKKPTAPTPTSQRAPQEPAKPKSKADNAGASAKSRPEKKKPTTSSNELASFQPPSKHSTIPPSKKKSSAGQTPHRLTSTAIKNPLPLTPSTPAPPTTQSLSLQHIKNEALTILKKRRCEVLHALQDLEPLIEQGGDETIKTAVRVLSKQVRAYEADISALESLGAESVAKGIDSNVLVALASCIKLPVEEEEEVTCAIKKTSIRISPKPIKQVPIPKKQDATTHPSTSTFTTKPCISPTTTTTTTNIIPFDSVSAFEGKSKKGNNGFMGKKDVDMGAGGSKPKPKTKLWVNKDGELRVRKSSVEVGGEKRKRSAAVEEGERGGKCKRTAIEGRNFAPLRMRRGVGDVMEVDGGVGRICGPGVGFTV
jgi:hypothetical protein